MVAIDGAGFDWSYMADDEVPTNIALMAFLDSEVHIDKTCSKTCLKSFETLKTQLDDLRIEFNKSEFNLANYKRGLASVEEQLVFYKKNKVIFYEQLVVLKRDIPYKDSKISILKRSQIPDKVERVWGFLEEFQQSEFKGYGPKTSKNVSEDTSNEVRQSPDAIMVEKLVSNDKLEKKIVFPTVAKIESVRPKQQEKPVRKPVKYAEMYRSQGPRGNQRNWNNQKSQQLGSDFVVYNKACFVCESFDHVQANYNYHQRKRVVSGNNYTRVNYNYSTKKAHPSAHRNMAPRAVLMKTGLRPLNTARPKAVNTARPNSVVVNAIRGYQGHLQKEDQGYVNSGCSRHMRGNISYLSDFKEFDGGYVTFRGGAERGKITGKGTLKMGKLDFENVYFVKELQFNLFSVSQMCDKKNSVLFTDTGCFVLSPDFKLADESQVLLKVPRKNNMYSVDMKNIIPRESLTCLVAKATLDELMLCHGRLGHVKFKTINKLVKENLVRGLPSKHFENDQTCVACLKGKQHKASCKSKIQNSITQPLFMLHMDLFGPTFDETSGILKSFITEIENLVDKKVKIIRCDNGTEFKNRVMSDGPKWLFDIDVLTKSMNYVPVVASTNSNDSVGTKVSVGTGHSSKEIGSSQDYILMPLWKDGSLFDYSLKNASNDEPQPSSDAGKKDDEGVSQESGIDDQERPGNNTQDVNTAGPSINTASTNVNNGSLNINNVSLTVTTAPLEATHANYFSDKTELDISNITTTYLVPSTLNTRIHKDHSLDHVIGDVQSSVQTRRMTKTSNEQGRTQEGDSSFDRSKLDRINQDELLQNKKDERGIMIRNKARLVAQGYTQEEGIDYDEVFALVARIDVIRMFLAYASFKYFVVYQMDVKSAFLYGKIEEEVYVCLPPGFDDPEFPDRVYKIENALYGLHQAPRAWSTRTEMCTEFEKMMHKKFQLSSMGELTFFLGLQVTQKDDEIFISQDKHVDEILKKFGFSTVKTASTPMETSKPLLKDAKAKDVDVHLYR
ncbi:putative ribonuclease H-like domain-containing protein [Tanacetum coccineum]